MIRKNLKSKVLLAALVLALPLFATPAAQAVDAAPSAQDQAAQYKEIADQIRRQEERLASQEQQLRAQQAALVEQAALIEKQRRALETLANIRAAGVQQPKAATIAMQPVPDATAVPLPVSRPMRVAQTVSPPPPSRPVGEAPEEPSGPPQVVESLPEGMSVLTPPGQFTFTPSLEYTQTSNDRLVYRGVVIVPGINLGEVEASTDDQSIFTTVLGLRYGIAERFEIELRVPFVVADDRATVLSQGPSGSATQSLYITGKGLGDVELAGRYQINKGLEDWPVFVANARVKSNTGTGPYDIDRDPAGIAEEIALGSGFWGLQAGFSMLKVSDPAVLFASASFLYSIPKNINKTIGDVFIGRVEPSNSVSLGVGFGFAVNPDFSFSLGYQHSRVFPQYSELDGTRQSTTSLAVGAMTLGMSYRITQSQFLNANFEFGVTQDAPDMRAVISVPFNL